MEKIVLGEGKAKQYKNILIAICFVSISFIVFYVILGIRSCLAGNVSTVFKLLINVLMHISILQYVRDVFYYGKDGKLEPMLMKFSMSMMSVLIAYKTKEPTYIFSLVAISIMLIPYMSASLTNVKRSKIILAVVLIITLLIAFDSIKNPPEDYTFGFGPIPYNVNALNQTVEWIIFTALYLVRGKVEEEKLKNATEC